MSDLALCSWNGIAFKHNLCDELTRLHPKISFGPDSQHADNEFKVSAKPRKHEVIPTPDNKEKIEDNTKDTSDQITWEEFVEKHTPVYRGCRIGKKLLLTLNTFQHSYVVHTY